MLGFEEHKQTNREGMTFDISRRLVEARVGNIARWSDHIVRSVNISYYVGEALRNVGNIESTALPGMVDRDYVLFFRA